MSLNKAIESGKEHRKKYGEQGDFCKSVDKRCRNHGGCKWCEENRMYKNLKRLEKSKYMEV